MGLQILTLKLLDSISDVDQVFISKRLPLSTYCGDKLSSKSGPSIMHGSGLIITGMFLTQHDLHVVFRL